MGIAEIGSPLFPGKSKSMFVIHPTLDANHMRAMCQVISEVLDGATR